MENGSLEKFTDTTVAGRCLLRERLYDIALGIARGIEYLHQGFQSQRHQYKACACLPSVEEFCNEVATIGRIHHVNVVRLLGFCVEGS
ncbi:hypothetical protein EJ110_NYTH59666 [Nymphaea thermarum]|nr:hypothetical protein EJ110_NYTH59666 [Nymphaea thermarum]